MYTIFVFHSNLQKPYSSSDSTFKISIESFNKKLTVSQQRELIDVSILESEKSLQDCTSCIKNIIQFRPAVQKPN